jgi:GDPmannose 4,6-dehydratase
MTQPKIDLITGSSGQHGRYLAEFLLEKGYSAHSIKRRFSSFKPQRVDHIYQEPRVDNVCIRRHYGDMSDSSNLIRIIRKSSQMKTIPWAPKKPCGGVV